MGRLGETRRTQGFLGVQSCVWGAGREHRARACAEVGEDRAAVNATTCFISCNAKPSDAACAPWLGVAWRGTKRVAALTGGPEPQPKWVLRPPCVRHAPSYPSPPLARQGV